MKTFSYKKNRIAPDLPAQEVGEELERIREKNGVLTAEAVVNASRSSDALLHKELDLHIPEAARAEMWSVHKARNIINVLVVEESKPGSKKTTEVSAYINVTVEQKGRSYVPVHDVLSDPVLRAKAVQRCLDKLVSVQREFRVLQEFASVWASIDEFRLSHA